MPSSMLQATPQPQAINHKLINYPSGYSIPTANTIQNAQVNNSNGFQSTGGFQNTIMPSFPLTAQHQNIVHSTTSAYIPEKPLAMNSRPSNL